MFYYLFDNLVWMANMGAIYKQLIENTLAWRDVRNAFSFIKTVCETLTGVIKLHQSRCRVLDIEQRLFNFGFTNWSKRRHSQRQSCLYNPIVNQQR